MMSAYLKSQDLWEVVGPEVEDLVAKGVKGVAAKEKKKQIALAKITMCVDSSQLPFFQGSEDPRDVWNLLEFIHRSGSINSILSLRRRFFRMSMHDTESAMQWISRVQKAAMELQHTPVPIALIDVILVISDGLPPSYDPVITALDTLEYSQLTLPLVISRVIGHESKLTRSKEKLEEVLPSGDGSALVARRNDRSITLSTIICYNCGGRGHVKAKCPSAPLDLEEHARVAVQRADEDEAAMLAHTMGTIQLF